MFRKTLSLLLALALALSVSIPALGAEAAGSAEELRAVFLANAGAQELEITCGSALWERLTAANFQDVFREGVQAGAVDMSVRYSPSDQLLLLSGITWKTPGEDYVCAECADLAGARGAVERIIQSGKRGVLLCTEDMIRELYSRGGMYSLLAGLGYEDCDMNVESRGNYLALGDFEPFELPWYAAGSEGEIITAVNEAAQAGYEEFILVPSAELYTAYGESSAAFRAVLAMTNLRNYSYSGYAGAFTFRSAEYSFEPRLRCGTEEDIIQAIRGMGALGETAFDLVLDGELFAAVTENGMERLNRLESEAGMTSCSLRYNTGSFTLLFEEAQIAAEVVPLVSIPEALAYLEKCAAREDASVNLFCSEELYNSLLEGVSQFSVMNSGMAYIYDLMSMAGMFDSSFSYSPSTRIITIYVDAWYPGGRILRRARSGDLSGLTERELQALETAKVWAEEARGADDRETAKNLHDRLCAAVVYTDDESTDEDDTAIGALLNGQANCDGYSDAFYLLGGLAGLNVRSQHGDSKIKGLADAFGGVTHMWNLLELNGTWRLVDVTWDDRDDGEPEYTWFDLGEDRARLTHEWNAEMTVPLLKETDLTVRPDYEYIVNTPEELEAALDASLAKGQRRIHLFFPDGDAAEELRQATMNTAPGKLRVAYTWSYVDKMHLFKIWY